MYAIEDGEAQIIVSIGSDKRKNLAKKRGIEVTELNKILYDKSLAKAPPNKTKKEIKAIDAAKAKAEADAAKAKTKKERKPRKAKEKTVRMLGVDITQDTILKTRKVFADNNDAVIADIKSGKEKVDNPASVIKWQEQMKADVLAGKSDNTFSFAQRAVYLQTGEEKAFLPK